MTLSHRLLAGAALAPAFSLLATSAALAQSQVTMFGVLDLALTRVSASGAGHQSLLNGDGNTSSRFGLRGSEDLGGGLKANFWIESAINVDTGTSGATSSNNQDSINTGGLTWGRRSTLGLQGAWGELRLGRDYVPSFSNLTTAMHPFGTNGVGSSGLLFYPVNAGGTTQRTSVRASNSIGYHLPAKAGGFYGAAMVATGENAGGTPTSKNGEHRGIRIGWRGGDWNMAAAIGKTRYATGNYTQSNVGVNYQLGAFKLMSLWGENKIGITRTRALMLGTQWDVSAQGELRLAYTTLKARGVANDASHLALGYVHNLSKRSALYATAARIDNKGTGRRFNVGLAPVSPGGSSTGLEAGVRHSF